MFGNASSALDCGTGYLSVAGDDPDAMMDWAPTTAPAFLPPRPIHQRVFGDPRPATPNMNLFRSNSASAFVNSASGFGLGTARRVGGEKENYFGHRNAGRGNQADVDALINGFGGGIGKKEEEEESGWELAPQKFFAPEVNFFIFLVIAVIWFAFAFGYMERMKQI